VKAEAVAMTERREGDIVMHRHRIIPLVAVSASLILAGGVSVVPGAASASVAANPTQTCPIIAGIDPDFVVFSGPATIPGDGLVHTVSVSASESEAARNLMSLTTVTTSGTTIKVISGVALHNTSVHIPLAGTPGRTYTINWIATFDFGPHVCTSLLPGHQAFTVTVH
jgi:hypothetical protein